MNKTWKQDFFTQLNILACARNSAIYNPKKKIGATTPRLETAAGLSHTAWNITEKEVYVHFYINKAKDDPKTAKEVSENDERYSMLLLNKIQIEKQFGTPLAWKQTSTNRRIASCLTTPASEYNRPEWPRIQVDLLDRFEKLRKILIQFAPLK